VADMLTAHESYKTSHEALFLAKTKEEIAELSKKIVENYLENRWIWDELNYYKQHGTILGKHRIFSWMKRRDQVHKMKTNELVTRKINLELNLRRNKLSVKRQPDHPLTFERTKKIGDIEIELNEINRLLNF
jgi:hypothetical protein